MAQLHNLKQFVQMQEQKFAAKCERAGGSADKMLGCITDADDIFKPTPAQRQLDDDAFGTGFIVTPAA